MRNDLSRLASFVEAMNSSNSTNHKVEVLSSYSNDDFIRKVLLYTYHPYKQYGITSKNLKKNFEKVAPFEIYSDFFALLDDLNDRNLTGHAAIEAVNFFIQQYLEFSDLLYQIIDRNLETRATTTLINRVMGDLIPTFNVALAHDFNKVKGVDLQDGSWFLSRKLDGVRCITIIESNTVKFFSRNGKQFETLGRIAEELLQLGIDNLVLDGEICLMKENGEDDFQGILKQIQRKDHTIDRPKYWVFDILTLDEFNAGTGTTRLSDRLCRHNFDSQYISNLTQQPIVCEEDLVHQKENSKTQGWEGLIARRDVGYEGDRTKNMLKLKEFYDSEYQVIETIFESQRVIVNGQEIEEEMLSAVIVEHKGNRVRVGSGFTLDERREYFRNPEKILEKIITVTYFEETLDQHGKHSLRFPVFKWNHGKSRSI